MYEQSLLCGIMNDWYGSMEDLFQDLKHYGFEVLESNRESITVSCDDDGDCSDRAGSWWNRADDRC